MRTMPKRGFRRGAISNLILHLVVPLTAKTYKSCCLAQLASSLLRLQYTVADILILRFVVVLISPLSLQQSGVANADTWQMAMEGY